MLQSNTNNNNNKKNSNNNNFMSTNNNNSTDVAVDDNDVVTAGKTSPEEEEEEKGATATTNKAASNEEQPKPPPPPTTATIQEDPADPEDISAAALEEEEACLANKNNSNADGNHPMIVMRHYQWLYDRCDGTSKYNSGTRTYDDAKSRPPCFICYVPIPVRWLADYIEMNEVFEAIGRIGCVDPEDPQIRTILFSLALFCNFTSFFLTLFAIMAATLENYDLLRATSFTRGIFRVNNFRGIPVEDSQADFGLRAIALREPTEAPNGAIYKFADFCNDIIGPSFETSPDVFISREQCETCDQASFPIIFSLLISLVFIWPTVTTNFLRMWPNYDVNCQKFFGAVVGLISLVSSCYSWFGYTNSCFNNFSQGHAILYQNFTLVPDDQVMLITKDNEDDFLFTHRDWDAGPGLIAIVVATLLKGLDAIFNWIVPTPSITRDHDEQRDYEYLSHHHRSPSVFEKVHQKHRQEEVHEAGLVLVNPNHPLHHQDSSRHHLHHTNSSSRHHLLNNNNNNNTTTSGGGTPELKPEQDAIDLEQNVVGAAVADTTTTTTTTNPTTKPPTTTTTLEQPIPTTTTTTPVLEGTTLTATTTPETTNNILVEP